MKWILLGLIFAIVSGRPALADDWPCWRGPALNGVSAEKEWSAEHPDGEPKISWKGSVGTGFSSVSVVEGRLYTIGNREGTETVSCLDAKTGEELWKHAYECALDPKYFEGGPTSTPTVDGGVVYTLSRAGHLFAFDGKTGDIKWSKNIAKENGMPAPTWGFSGSPLVQGNLIVLNMGESGIACEKATGKVSWKSAAEEPGYSTAVPLKRSGKDFLLLGGKTAWRAIDVETGKEIWSYRWLTRYGVNAADPIVAGDRILISSGYGKGSALLSWPGLDAEPEEVWKNKQLRSQMNPAVLIDGHLYGTDGDAGNKNDLRCVELATGMLKWKESGVGTGGVTAADGKLIVLSARGELIIARASPAKFDPISRAQVLGGKCWTVPVLANGLIYCRNAAGDLVCVDMSR